MSSHSLLVSEAEFKLFQKRLLPWHMALRQFWPLMVVLEVVACVEGEASEATGV